MTLPIPPDLLEHPTLNEHPAVAELHTKYGGVPADADDEVVERVLVFANAVANAAIEPGTKTRRADPSPRRTARIWRAEILGRDASVSPDRERRTSVGGVDNERLGVQAQGGEAGQGGQQLGQQGPQQVGQIGQPGFRSVSLSPARVRYRSRSRQPTQATVKEEPDDDGNTAAHFGAGRAPGRRDLDPDPSAPVALRHLEHRVSMVVQQQHEAHDRLLKRVGDIEKRLAAGEARNQNKVNAYLGRPLVPVTNGVDPVPAELPPLTSPDIIHTLDRADVDKWLDYYTGTVAGSSHAAAVSDRAARQALRACTGIDVQLI